MKAVLAAVCLLLIVAAGCPNPASGKVGICTAWNDLDGRTHHACIWFYPVGHRVEIDIDGRRAGKSELPATQKGIIKVQTGYTVDEFDDGPAP